MHVSIRKLCSRVRDAEAECARLSALLGVAQGLLARKDSMLEVAAANVRGYTLYPDGSVAVKFTGPVELTDRLTADVRLFDTVDAAIERLVTGGAVSSS